MGGTMEDAGAIERAAKAGLWTPCASCGGAPAAHPTSNTAGSCMTWIDPADAARFADVSDSAAMAAELRGAAAELAAQRAVEAQAKAILKAYFDKLSDVVAKVAPMGGAALEAVLIAHGIPVPPGTLAGAAGKLAESGVAEARGGIAGAGPA